MTVTLDKDLCFFDIESTGLNVLRDRILQLAIIKYPKNNKPVEELSLLINPGVPISEEAFQVHGISAKDLANKPVFSQVADKINKFIGEADLAGYNSNRFDIPMLIEEFARVGIDFDMSKRRTIDVQRIFYKMEPRTLKAALRFYCQKELVDAHDALSDVRATISVFEGQLAKYVGKEVENDDGVVGPSPITKDIQQLHDFTNDLRFVDATQKLRVEKDGTVVFNFGKYEGKPAGEVLYNDRNYYNWIMTKEFSSQVKQAVKSLLKDYANKMDKDNR
jgi:DNA polymerase III subunit epsilon